MSRLNHERYPPTKLIPLTPVSFAPCSYDGFKRKNSFSRAKNHCGLGDRHMRKLLLEKK